MESSGEGNDPISKVLGYLIQFITIILIYGWRKKIIPIVIKEKPLWLFLGIIFASLVWSDAPSETVKSLMGVLRISLFGTYFGTRYSMKEQLRLLAWVFGISVVLSFVFAIALPSYGVMGKGGVVTAEGIKHAGAWRGIYIHKNPLGRMMVLSSIVFFIWANISRRYQRAAWTGFIFSIVLILASTAKSALIFYLTIMMLLPLYRALRWNYSWGLPFFIIVILLGGSASSLVVDNAETILDALGKDMTLSGRTDLWAAVLDKIWERPWLGYGYGGFWRGMNGESADVIAVLKWEAPHSHNGLLDLWVEVGLLGLSAFLVSFISVAFKGVMWIRQTKTAEGLWPLAYLTFLFLVNITESSLMRQNAFWILYVAVALSLHNKKLNLAESDAIWQQKVKAGARKEMTLRQGRN